jgi:hypothetical protein
MLATSSDPAHFTLNEVPFIVGADSVGTPQTCTVRDVSHSGQSVTIDAYASSDDSYERVTVLATLPPDISIRSWSDSQK